MNLRLPLNLDGLLRQRTVEDERIEYKVGNPDPIWLHQNEMWEVLHEREMVDEIEAPEISEESKPDDVPF